MFIVVVWGIKVAVMCEMKNHHITANFDELCLLTLHACAPGIAAKSNGKESRSHTHTTTHAAITLPCCSA